MPQSPLTQSQCPHCLLVCVESKPIKFEGTGVVARKYIAAKSANDHLKSAVHKKAQFHHNICPRNIQYIFLGPSPADMIAGEERRLRAEVDKILTGVGGDSLSGAVGEMSAKDRQNLLREEEQEQLLAEMMANTAINDQLLDQALHGAGKDDRSEEWYPYNSKAMCILDILDNLPRLPISDSLMKLFIWTLKECGVSDAPSFYALRKVQAQLRDSQGIPCIECKSPQGNVFYFNDPRYIIAQDWSHPQTFKFIQPYPVIPENGVISEIHHAAKWRTEMDVNHLTPMYDSGTKHYYVLELSRLKNGDMVIPMRWVIFKDKVCADAILVITAPDGRAHVDESTSLFISSDELALNYLDLLHEGTIPLHWTDASAHYISKMPNHHREIAGGDPLYVSFIDLFGDDASGNRSKAWNKHDNTYLTHRNLPRKLLQQEYHIHLLSTSQHATIPEQYHAIKKVIDQTHHTPVRVRRADGVMMRFMVRLNVEPSDNPAQSDVAGHIGSKGNHPCRKCGMGGTEEERSSDLGFPAMFKAGTPRTGAGILSELETQVDLACKGFAKDITQRQTDTGTKDGYTQYWIDNLVSRSKTMRKTSPEITDDQIYQELAGWVAVNREQVYNPFLLTDGFDPAKDTPVEILHTILLGTVKYNWYYSHSKWSDEQKRQYSIRLQATDTLGLSIPPIRATYITQFANSLIGRQLKTIVQTAAFHMHDIVSAHHFAAWKAIGRLSALLWHVEIDNIDQYCQDVEIEVANVQDMFAIIDPTKILRKIKNHLLAHLSEDTCRLGPLLGVITEGFEAYNGVFRNCSVFSNHLAPSRDIARQTGDQESLKQRITGGQWLDSRDGSWVMAGSGVRKLVTTHPILHSLIGWSSTYNPPPGSVVPLPEKTANSIRQVKLTETMARQATNFASFNSSSAWTRCKSAFAQSSDECRVGSWVFYKSPITHQTLIGRVNDILSNPSHNVAVIEEFHLGPTKDEFFDLPYLFRRQGEVSFVIVPTKNVTFLQNVQHDCRRAQCEGTGTRKQRQERVESERAENYLEHKTDDYFLVNLFAFHNAHLTRRVLPRHLTAPVALFPDRQKKHVEIAGSLRETLWGRKEERRQKRDEKKLKKKLEKEAEALRRAYTKAVSEAAQMALGGVSRALAELRKKRERRLERQRRRRATQVSNATDGHNEHEGPPQKRRRR